MNEHDLEDMEISSNSGNRRLPPEPDHPDRAVDLSPRALEHRRYLEYWRSVFPFNPPDIGWQERRKR